jgi:4a-hydroxytetrahydrobiopterin dehydratase
VNTTGSNWSEVDGKLFRRINFTNFRESLDYVNKVGELAEKAGHHPDISFGWGYVEIKLFTHDLAKISKKDMDLAKEISKLS